MDKRITLAEVCYPNRKAYLNHQEEFYQTFKRPLSDFWQSNLFGLDVIKFDAFIAPKPNESTREAIIRKYGEKAWNLVDSIMNPKRDWMEE